MQINPHYMYNTLASVKWLIWQGDSEKSTKVIDAFISLLRNTISNTDEFIPLEQEIENLKNYVLINETRYGDRIRTEFYVPSGCGAYKVPKLILQPFVENAFFHAFPEGQSGVIQIFVREKEGTLVIEIADDGVGLADEKLASLKKREKGEHFTGIGVNNVDDRLKMIYGEAYGISIRSGEGKGTTVWVRIPIK
ncbi:MAG: histidine kinase [Eubacteriales bacterium]|nr:histidine kinase [Eubacteriales bacterium]